MDTNRFRRNRTDYSAPQRRHSSQVPKNPARQSYPGPQPNPTPIASNPTLTPTPTVAPQQYVQPKPELSYRPEPVQYPSIEPDNYDEAGYTNNIQSEEKIDLNEPWKGGWLESISPPNQSTDASQTNDVPEAAEMSQTLPSATSNISIQINMPKLHWPKIKLPPLPYKKIAIWVGIGIVSLVIIIGAIFTVKHFFFKPKPVVSMGASQDDAAILTSPTFKPVAPKSKPNLAQGSSQATSFDGKLDSYSFTDSLNGVPLTVSQQPIPATFSSASQALSSVAKSMNAKTIIPTSSGLPAYEVFNANTSIQSLVFTMNNLLIFIQSNFQHSNAEWTNYINSLIS